MNQNKTMYKKKRKSIKNLNRNILKIFNKNPNKVYNYKQVCKKMGILNTDGKTQIIKNLIQLTNYKNLTEIDRGKYKININKNYHIGTLDIISNGNAYFISDDFEYDIFAPSVNLNKALHGDTVKGYVYKKDKSKKLEIDIIEIIKRKKTEFVGILQINKNSTFIIPDSRKMYVDIIVSKGTVNHAKQGDKVIISITHWPDNSKNPFGKIIHVLGKSKNHNTQIHSILFEYGLPFKFSEEIEKEAQKLPTKITQEQIDKRRDMRGDLTFTIDPKDAKDFDDALSFKVLENGNYQIGIHIADVSHYLQPKTILDQEAYNRATSVYLVDRVVPMLPEILSNGLCSLRANEEKLTFSAIFELNDKSEVIDQWFGKTVIYSNQRFSYEEAQEIIENCSVYNTIKSYTIPSNVSISGKKYKVSEKIVEAILKLDKLAKKLRQKRINKGALSFDKIEVKFHLDKKSNPTGVYFKESKDANKLIEEFMLLANKKVAEFIGEKNGKPTKKTFIYRIHDKPNIDKLISLQQVVNKLGYSINIKTKEKISQSLNKLLKEVNGKKEANMVEILTIRSMSKASYTTKNIGHYGLSFNYYSHFTSPIRRYPDVMTHRLLQHYLDGGSSPEPENYQKKCKHSSKMEELAIKAERDSIKYMQIKYMQNHKEEEFEGLVTGVTEWGIYVEIKKNKCEGMIHIKNIKGDYYIFDQKKYAIIGQSTKKSIQLGDQVVVTVKKIDLERKYLDFNLISHA